MATDPYKYFRVEARELLDGLTEGVLQYEKGVAATDVVPRLLRLAHTLKGAARVVRQPGIAELAHAIEGALTAQRDSGQAPSPEQASELLRLLDEAAAHLRRLDPVSEPKSAGAPRDTADEPLETLRVQIEDMDSLLRGVTEAGVQLGAVRKALGAVDHLRELMDLLIDRLSARNGSDAHTAPARGLAEEIQSGLERVQRTAGVDLERVEGEFAELRDVAHRLRLIPAHSVFQAVQRAVRDAAQELGKRVDFEASGGDVRLDASVLASLRDALAHVARNAVAHGIEAEAERAAVGKAPAGRVRLVVERRGNRVAFVCSDDGRGIDVEAVRSAAISRGRVPASEARSWAADRVLGLLHEGGLTTSRGVTELSGRGIGLDVVRATTHRLKGELSIRSEPGRGATFEIRVPVSIASLTGVLVEAGDARAAIPLDAIHATVRVHEADVAHSTERDSILHEGEVVPFVPLDELLQRAGSSRPKRSAWSAVVVKAHDRRVAVGVDRLLGTANIVLQALPQAVGADAVVAGATLDAEGNPQLVLDPGGLVAAGERGRGAVSDAVVARPAPVLVVDDSLTTRMLEQSILESAGYDVELAVSAEDALAKANDRRYSLFIVDVEMPGMDGFGFVAQTRAHPVLREIPAILVTSRNAIEDRRRGESVGASAYIVKGEFDQRKLLQTIRGLIGSS